MRFEHGFEQPAIGEVRVCEHPACVNALLEGVPDAVFRQRADGKVLAYKPSRRRMLRVESDDLVGHSLDQIGGSLDFLTPEMLEQHMWYVDLALRTGEPQTFELQLGETAWGRTYELRVCKVAPDEVVGTAREISARVRERERREASQRAYQRLVDRLLAREARRRMTLANRLRQLDAQLAGDGGAARGQLQRLIHDLWSEQPHPSALADELRRRTAGVARSVACRLRLDLQPAHLSRAIAQVVIRAVEGALSLAATGDVSRVRISAVNNAEMLSLIISDDGRSPQHIEEWELWVTELSHLLHDVAGFASARMRDSGKDVHVRVPL